MPTPENDTVPPRRRGRPPKALQSAESAPQAPTATPVADDGQIASQSRTGAIVSPDQTAIVAAHLQTWLSSLARGSRHD